MSRSNGEKLNKNLISHYLSTKEWIKHNLSLEGLSFAILDKLSYTLIYFSGVDIDTDEDEDELVVGQHMTITSRNYTGLSLELSDKTILKTGDFVGEISISYNLPSLYKDENLISFVRQGFKSVQVSLEELAILCSKNDSRLDGINFFYGVSHLSGPLARRLGFDTVDLTNPFSILTYRWVGKRIAEEVAGENDEWKKFQKNFKNPQQVFISRTKLMQLFLRKT